MTETSMLVAQLVLVVVLFGFMWAVVRSAWRTLARTSPPSLPLTDPVVTRDTAAHHILERSPAAVVVDLPDELPPVPAPGPNPHGEIARIDMPDPGFLRDEPATQVPEAAPPPEIPATERAYSQSTAEVLAAGIEPRLIVESGPSREGLELPLGGGLTIGRSDSNDLHLDDSYLSHMHARILRRGSFFFVQDLGSTNGTFLNGQRVEHAQLRVRDTLRMGETTLRYEE